MPCARTTWQPTFRCPRSIAKKRPSLKCTKCKNSHLQGVFVLCPEWQSVSFEWAPPQRNRTIHLPSPLSVRVKVGRNCYICMHAVVRFRWSLFCPSRVIDELSDPVQTSQVVNVCCRALFTSALTTRFVFCTNPWI